MFALSPILPALIALLGPRRAEIMQHLWIHGAATVRELHTWLTRAEPLAYTTVMTTCVRLWEKGLLDRRHHVAETDATRHSGRAYVYTPRLSEVEFLRAATTPASDPPYPQLAGIPHHHSDGTDRVQIEALLAYLGTLREATGQLIDVQAEYERMQAHGANFTMPPTKVTGSTIAMLEDTCGNLIQIAALDAWGS
jgi:predicted transcriptional regulator